MIPKLPDEDLRLINDSFKEDKGSEVLIKNADGKLVKAVKKVSNKKTIKMDYLQGKILRHQKSVVTKEGQIIIGIKGQRYEDISPKLRNLVTWDESELI